MSKFSLYPISRVAHVALASLLTVFRRLGGQRQRPGASRRTTRYKATAVNPPNRQRPKNGSPYPPRSRGNGMRTYPGLIGLGLAVVLMSLIGLGWSSPSRVDAASTMTIQLPLSTSGSKIVDASGKSVLLRGVNWFGIETELHAPDGLSSRDYKDMLAQIKSLGYNLIRLPYSVQSLRSQDVQGINYQLGSNQELQGKSPLEVMDAVIQESNRLGLLVLLDSHRLNDQRIPELWYGDGFTEADWIDTWKMLG